MIEGLSGSGAAGITLAGGTNGNSDLTIVDCVVTHTSRGQAGIDVGPNHGSLLLVACAIGDCGGNGALGDEKRGYGILRQRAPGAGSPTTITLIGNVLAESRGLVAGRSDAQLGNYDQLIDPADAQAPY